MRCTTKGLATMIFRFPLFFVVVLLAVLTRAGVAQANPGPGAIAALLQRGPTIELAGRTVETRPLDALYRPRGYQAIWTRERRSDLAAALAEAPSHGLDPGAYAIPDADPAGTELLLTDEFLRYASVLARGTITMSDVYRDWLLPQPAFDPDLVLERAMAHGVAVTLAGLAPQDDDYKRLRQAYLRYRDFGQHAGWRPIAFKLPLKLGDRGPGVMALRQRLAAEGFMAPGDAPDYDADLAAAVSRFQTSRGLPPDGTVGRATLTALNITPGALLRTIRLNLERRRAMPRDLPATRIVVNVADATLKFDEKGQTPLSMRVIVGRPALKTPVMKATLTSLLLNPPWVVPRSISVNEILLAARKDPDYLERHNYYYGGANGEQLIQQPGPQNALGRIKFEMPNNLDIYMHDTPAPELMARARRALSHGCIRVEHPRELARRVMAGDPKWTLDAIDAAIATSQTQRIALPHPIPVYVVYLTAYVGADGIVEFRSDVYDRDLQLDETLMAHNITSQIEGLPVTAAHN
jgi:L,D-transpeptidase YcbB